MQCRSFPTPHLEYLRYNMFNKLSHPEANSLGSIFISLRVDCDDDGTVCGSSRYVVYVKDVKAVLQFSPRRALNLYTRLTMITGNKGYEIKQ